MKHYVIVLFKTLGLLITLLVITNCYIYLTTKPYIFNEISSAPKSKVALVLGAAVSDDGSLSPIFKDRIDVALTLYKNKIVSKILVSGDNSTDEYNEVNPARLYLIAGGVSSDDIYLDHAGFDTYSSMYRARDIFDVSSLLVVTQSFHLPRSVFIARELGIEAYGVNADKGHILFKNTIREIFANEKTLYMILFNIQPKFLGKEIPIK